VEAVRLNKFHGRVGGGDRPCASRGCEEAGEFRAPGERGPGFDGPGDYRWFCLDHVRAFNASYDWFEGMSAEEILAAQHPVAGWERETRAFGPTAGIEMPRWADFADPLEAIAARARARMPLARADGRILTAEQRRALDVLSLGHEADRGELRRRYSVLVRQYHPDRNGGDRSFETRLQQVVEAYQILRKIFA
jgi:hypothetical protein